MAVPQSVLHGSDMSDWWWCCCCSRRRKETGGWKLQDWNLGSLSSPQQREKERWPVQTEPPDASASMPAGGSAVQRSDIHLRIRLSFSGVLLFVGWFFSTDELGSQLPPRSTEDLTHAACGKQEPSLLSDTLKLDWIANHIFPVHDGTKPAGYPRGGRWEISKVKWKQKTVPSQWFCRWQRNMNNSACGWYHKGRKSNPVTNSREYFFIMIKPLGGHCSLTEQLIGEVLQLENAAL